MRRYVLGALLLDLDDPRRVIGQLREPLLAPEGTEREGYVPNVVYSCGAMLNGSDLVLPYGFSDGASASPSFRCPNCSRSCKPRDDRDVSETDGVTD